MLGVQGAAGVIFYLLGAVAGTAGQLQQESLWAAGVYLAMLLGGVAALGSGMAVRRPVVSASLLALAGAWTLSGWAGLRATDIAGQQLSSVLEGVPLQLSGRVVELPRQGPQSVQFELEVDTARWNGRSVGVPPRVQLGWSAGGDGRRPDADEPDEGEGPSSTPSQLRAGQRWNMTVRLQRPHGLANPGGFDAELWFWERGIGATGWVLQGRRWEPPRLLDAGSGHSLVEWRQAVRDAIWRRVPDRRSAGVLAALVVGDQAAIDGQTWEVFRRTGVAHLISISGLHVTMFAALAVWLVGACWRLLGRAFPGVLYRLAAPRAAAVGGLTLALAYAVFAGWGVPAQRTVLMLAVAMGLRLSARRWPWPMVWLLVMVAVLLWDPWALLQPGFWLSFVAVGVLFASSPSSTTPVAGVRARVVDLLRTQAIVTVALTPLTLLLFGQASVVGLLANLVAIPWVTWLVTPLALLGTLLPWLWTGAAMAVSWMAWALDALATLSWAAWERPMVPAALALVAVAGGVLMVLRLPWSLRAWGLWLAWPALVYWPTRPAPGEFELLAADVGQGSAVIVRTAKHTLLFDTGPVSRSGRHAVQAVLLPLLRGAGERPDMVIVSHDDSDHAGGLEALAMRFPQSRWLASFDTATRGGLSSRLCEAGQQWTWDGVGFDVLHPLASDHGSDASDNAMSCVLRVRAAGGRPSGVALLTGDIGVREEAQLLAREPDLRTHLLLVAHHGSASSTGTAWLEALQPRLALVQSGHRNRYRHPAPKVVQRLEQYRVPTYSSPGCGAALWRSERAEEVHCERQHAPRYWHHVLAPLMQIKQDEQAPQRLAR